MSAATSNPCNAPTLTVASDRSAKRALLLIAAERYAEASVDGYGGVELRALGEAAKAWVRAMQPVGRQRKPAATPKPKRELQDWYGHWQRDGAPFKHEGHTCLKVVCACGTPAVKKVPDLERGGHDQRCFKCNVAKSQGHRGYGAVRKAVGT